jgi:uncharacterized protein
MTTLSSFRKDKDNFFGTNHHSPISASEQVNFKGLNYFEENTALKLELTISKFDNPINVEMQTTTGEMRTYQKLGTIIFNIEGEDATLTIFSTDHGLFLPFVDSQAGKETYGAGRYLDPPLLPNGNVEIDFNLAYNPYCAYNESYSCPLPPAENRISVAILAGEKNYK